jgi:hypothetical protein
MKKFLVLFLLLPVSIYVFCQSTSNYPGDVDKAFGLIKNAAFKHGYKYLITFSEVTQAAINVEKNTSYTVFFVYDNSKHPAPNFKAFLMTPDSAMRQKYTAKPYDLTQVGTARAAQLNFQTKDLQGADTRPVKFEASPKATIYVFLKK